MGKHCAHMGNRGVQDAVAAFPELGALVSVVDFGAGASDPLDEPASLDVDPPLSELDVDPSDGVLGEVSEPVGAFDDPPDRLSVL